jgi:uncharacterized protein YkwD
MKKILTMALALIATIVATVPAFAAFNQEGAVEYLVYAGIYRGDENGNLNLDKGLTRAELAVILTRWDFIKKDDELNKWYTENVPNGAQPHKFTDVPDWAAPHVAYCYAKGYMNGISETRFDPSGQVNPKMVCTVVLRHLKLPETDWNYDTSVKKAQTIELTGSANVSGAIITRGDAAVVVASAVGGNYARTTPMPTPTPTTTPSATTAMTIEEMRTELIRLINVEREKAGLTPVEVLPELMDCAQTKAQDFNDNNYFAHNSPKYGTPEKMVKSFVKDADYGGEVIANITSGKPTTIVSGWIISKSHKAILMDKKQRYIGVGIVLDADGKHYKWVAQFIY